MMRQLMIMTALLLAAMFAYAEEADDVGAKEDKANQEQATEEPGDGVKSPKTMSGMSILGNEETPKSLVIVPWRSSELGDNFSLSDRLNDLAQPVDKEVFMRELSFYEIRSGE